MHQNVKVRSIWNRVRSRIGIKKVNACHGLKVRVMYIQLAHSRRHCCVVKFAILNAKRGPQDAYCKFQNIWKYVVEAENHILLVEAQERKRRHTWLT